MQCVYIYVPSSFFFASASMALVGSDPIERKQVIGTRILDSSNIPSMSRMTPSAYLAPMDSAMYFFAWAAVLSGTHDLHKYRGMPSSQY